MKRCTTCRRVYDRDAAVCAVDGSSLDDFVSDPLVGQTIAKRYRLVQRLGGGPLGAVYLATELATGKPVAVKILAKELRCDEETLKQCRWDARFATASHPASIVRVYEVDRTDEGQIFIAMDYLEGESLADIMHREGRLELVRALRLASQIAQALAAALNAGVVHSDIKPRNVMVVGPEERVKLTDFGIARLRRVATGGSLARSVGVAHEYAAPEQLLGGEAVDRTDIYGLGAVLHAMLTGAAPSPASGAATAGGRAEARRLVGALRPDVPASLGHLLTRALEREPERRPDSMSEVAEHLLDLTASIIADTIPAEAPFARPERALEPSVSAPRVDPLVVSEPASRRSYQQLWRSQGERWRSQRARLHALRQAYRGGEQAFRERWQSRRQAYGEQWRAQREHWQARWQTHQEASRARSEQQRLASQASRERRRTQSERRRSAWRASRERWQAQWLTYQARRHARRERRRLAWQARWQSYREYRSARRESLRLGWHAYRARWRTWRERWPAQDRWQAQLTEPPRRLIALARRRRVEDRQWAYAHGRALASSTAAALVVAGAIAWTAMYWRAEHRAGAPAPVAPLAARDSGSGGELGIESVSQSPAVAPRLVRSETGGTANLTPSRPAPVVTPGDDRQQRPEPIDTARGPEPAQTLLRVATALSGPQIARIQAQAEQKLRHRGLLRVSAADRWGVTLETAPSGEVALGGVLRDMALYDEAVRLVREVPGVKAVRGSVEVSNVGAASIVQSDTARIQAEIQQKLRSRGLLRESTADRWGVTVEVNPEGDVILVGAVRDVEMYSEAVRRAQEVARVRQVKQDIKVMERDTEQ